MSITINSGIESANAGDLKTAIKIFNDLICWYESNKQARTNEYYQACFNMGVCLYNNAGNRVSSKAYMVFKKVDNPRLQKMAEESTTAECDNIGIIRKYFTETLEKR